MSDQIKQTMKEHGHIQKAREEEINYDGEEVDLEECDRQELIGLIGGCMELKDTLRNKLDRLKHS